MHEISRIGFANSLRGFAALAVVISHYYVAFWSKRALIESITNSPALPMETHAIPKYISWLDAFPIFNWGSYGVALFFIISGFVIPFSLQKMSLAGFWINRTLRILPTYFAGFSITLLSIWMSSRYFSREWPYSLQEMLIHYIPGLRDIMWSRGIDGIVWTLEIEIKFYFLCALSIGWFRQQSLKVFIIPAALFAFALYINQMIPAWPSKNITTLRLALTSTFSSQYIIYMFVGVVFHYLYRRRISLGTACLGFAGLFAMFCINWQTGPYSANIKFAWSYAFALLTFAVTYSFPNLFGSNRVFDFLASISYPLYVIHGVAGYVALRIMLDMDIKAWLSLLIVTAACLFMSWLLHVLVESPSQKLGKRLSMKLSPGRSNDTAAKPVATNAT